MKTQAKKIIITLAAFMLFIFSVVKLGQVSRAERNAPVIVVKPGKHHMKDILRKDWQNVKFWINKNEQETDWVLG